MKTYRKFIETDIDCSEIGLIRRENSEGYFCTPKGAVIIGRAGVDGIHYCFVPGYGDTVFAVSPMNGVGEHIHPLAQNFRDFLRLLLACRDLAAMEQAWQWSREAFDSFVRDISLTDEQQRIHTLLAAEFDLTPMENPYDYMKSLQDRFDYSGIPFTDEYYDTVGEAAPPSREWQVRFGSSLFGDSGKGRPGEEFPLQKEFDWEGEQWYIPSLYVCGKGLVVDFCIAVDPARIRDYMAKWNLHSDGDGAHMTAIERDRSERENPLNIDFQAALSVNGKAMTAEQGSSLCFIPSMLLEKGTENSPEARAVVEHYGLDQWFGWTVHRISFPWAWSKKPQIRSLKLRLEGMLENLYGKPFPSPEAGASVEIPHPVTGVTHTLTAEAYEKRDMNLRHQSKDMEIPTHCTVMTYRLTPDLPDHAFAVRDVCANEPVKRKPTREYDFCSVAVKIIGGADGPTAVLFGDNDGTEKRHLACSALRFEPTEEIVWCPVFREKLRRDAEIELI